MENTTVTLVQWERELQALNNALQHLKMEGYNVRVNHNGFRGKATFLLLDAEGTSLTGSWSYDRLNHFIMGYGKAIAKTNAPELLEALINLVNNQKPNPNIYHGATYFEMQSKSAVALHEAQEAINKATT